MLTSLINYTKLRAMNNGKLYLRFCAFCAILCANLFSLGTIYEKTGFYAGLSAGVGYDAGNFFSGGGITTNDLGVSTVYGPCRSKISTCCFGKDFGGFVGYMAHLPKKDWLAGIEFGIEKPFYKKHFDNTLWTEILGVEVDAYLRCRMKTIYVTKLHVKIGKVLNEKWFVYGLAGADMKKIEVSMQEGAIGRINAKKTVFGLAVGLGAEREISTNWRLGLEVVNTYYPSKAFGVKNLNFRGNQKVKANTTQVALRLIYSF